MWPHLALLYLTGQVAWPLFEFQNRDGTAGLALADGRRQIANKSGASSDSKSWFVELTTRRASANIRELKCGARIPLRLHRKPISNPYYISTRKLLLAKDFGGPSEYHQSPESHLGILCSRGSISALLHP
jgi:hypothetical protein